MPPPRSKSDFPKVPVYLFYGDQVEEILAARDRLLDQLLAPELRHEYMTEHTPGRSHNLLLEEILGDISADLTTVSFLSDAPKVVIVTNPQEIYAPDEWRKPAKPKAKAKAKAKSKTPAAGAGAGEAASDPIARWFSKVLPGTGNHIVLQAFEDEAGGEMVDDQHPHELMQVIMRIGHTARFRSGQPLMFRIEEALLRRDLNGLLRIVRGAWKPNGPDQKIHGAALRSLRYLIQANIAREKRGAGASAESVAAFFSDSPQSNLMKAHEFVQKKYMLYPIYRTKDLLRAYEGMMDVYNAMRPRPGDLYVPDAGMLIERTLTELLVSEPPRR